MTRKGTTMVTMQVLVPKSGTTAARIIDAGSGVVTADDGWHDQLRVYFEGNRFGTAPTFEEKVVTAAGRLDGQYPTIACGLFARTDFVVVGTFSHSADWEDRALMITDGATVERWMRR